MPNNFVSHGLADDEDGGGGGGDEEPVLWGEGYDVEHGAAQLHNEDLPEEDEGGDEEEGATAAQVEGTATGEEGTGVEEVPELQHDEGGEE